MPLSTSRSSLARARQPTPATAPLPPHEAPTFARPLRIAQVTEYYYPHLGGICEHVHFFAREARRLGHHVDIVTSNLKGAPSQPHVIRLGRSQPVYFNGSHGRVTLGLGLEKQLERVFQQGRYDIVHVHGPLLPTLPLLSIDAAECPVVGTFHAYFEKSQIYAMSRRWFQRKLDRMAATIAVSKAATAGLSRYFEADWTIIPNGIDVDLFHPNAPVPPDFRRDVPVILFLGRFDPRNGLGTLIDAFKRIRGRNRKAQLVVVGDGPLRKHYYRLAAGDPGITFVGTALDSRPSYYANSAIYACPTTTGASFGITLLEAMACETPVVCSDIVGFRGVVKHEREALMFRCGDSDALADSLVRLLDDETLRARLGKTGRQNALRYAWPNVTAEVLSVYARVLGDGGS